MRHSPPLLERLEDRAVPAAVGSPWPDARRLTLSFVPDGTDIKVLVTGNDDRLDVSVTDDGIGLDPARRRDGLGLRGIEERVKELRGAMSIHGTAGQGTTLTIHLPLPAGITEVPLARAAG